MKKPSFFTFYYITNIFDLLTFDIETTALLNFFEISTEMHFVSLFFQIERNITTSILMIQLKWIHLKCTVLNYVNLDASPINVPYLRVVKYAISFFLISYLCLF